MTELRYRLLGRTGLRVSELFLGAMTFGDPDTVGAAPEECRRILDAYADAGGNVVDTAINYRGGASESILGELLEGRRDRFVVSTKYTVSRDGSDPNAAGNHRKNLRLSLDTSLRRLRTDYIDLYWVHLWDAHTPIEETKWERAHRRLRSPGRELGRTRCIPSSGPAASISCLTISPRSTARCRPRPCDVSTVRQTSSPASQPTSSTKRARGCSVKRLRESTRAESPAR